MKRKSSDWAEAFTTLMAHCSTQPSEFPDLTIPFIEAVLSRLGKHIELKMGVSWGFSMAPSETPSGAGKKGKSSEVVGACCFLQQFSGFRKVGDLMADGGGIPEVISRFTVDYSPAIQQTKLLAEYTQMLDNQLRNLRITAADIGKGISVGFHQPMQSGQVILDRHGKVLVDLSSKAEKVAASTKTVDVVTREHVRTVRQTAEAYNVLASAMGSPCLLVFSRRWILWSYSSIAAGD